MKILKTFNEFVEYKNETFLNESSIEIPDIITKFILAVQKGAYKRMSRDAQIKMIDKIKKESTDVSNLPQNITKKESNYLDTYASIKYQKINSELRSGNISTETKKIVDIIDGIMDKNVLKNDVIVYRGTSGNFSSKDEAYISTSVDVLTANNFARGDAKLQAYLIPKGTKCVYIGGGEKELLISRGFDLSKHLIKL